MRRAWIGLLATSACLEGQPVAWPEELALGWQCQLEGESLSQCVSVPNRAVVAAPRSMAEGLVIVGFTQEQLDSIDPRLDTNDVQGFELTPATPSDDPLCERYNEVDPDGRARRQLSALTRGFSFFRLSTETFAYEPAPAPSAVRKLSVRFPLRPCLESLRLDSRPFGEHFRLDLVMGNDDGVRMVTVTPERELVSENVRFLLVERGRDTPVWDQTLFEAGFGERLPPVSEEGPGWNWRVTDLALEPGDSPSRRGLAVALESRQPSGMSEERGRSAIVMFELASDGIRATRTTTITPAIKPSRPGQGLTEIEIEPDGAYVAVGIGLTATGTSIDAKPRIQIFSGIRADRLLLTGDDRNPHLISGDYGGVHLGNLHDGPDRLSLLEPFGETRFGVRGLASYQDELGRTWIHVSSDQALSARWIAGTEDFEPIPLWLPAEAASCGDERQPECGRIRIRPEVRSLGVIPTDDDTYQLFAGDQCTGVFAISVNTACTVAVSQGDTPVGFDATFRPRFAKRVGNRWLFFGGWRDPFPAIPNLADVGFEPAP